VVRRVGEVSYELELPEGSKFHNVFHVSCLKKAIGQQVTTSAKLPPLDEEGQLVLIPEDILDVRERRLRSRVIKEFLIRWRDLPVEDAMWEGDQILQVKLPGSKSGFGSGYGYGSASFLKSQDPDTTGKRQVQII
jgi:hypothetical protein